MSALQTLKRTQPAPDAHAIRGIKPQRAKKTKGKAAARAQRKRSKPLASQKPRRKQPQAVEYTATSSHKVSAPTYDQLIQEVLFLRGHVTELQKALAIVTAGSVLLRKERNGANAILRLIA